MKGLQRTCAPARYTRLIVLPRFLCVWLRNSRAPFPLKTHAKPQPTLIALQLPDPGIWKGARRALARV